MPSSDESLYLRLLDGDMSAFDALYQRYERPLFGFIRRFVADSAQAEEIFHEAFLAVLRQGQERRAVTHFRPWLYRVTRNLCLNRLRSRDRASRAMAELAAHPPPGSDRPDARLSHAQIEHALQRAVARLPDELGELYAMRASGMSYEGVAELLGIPLGTVKSRMNRMLERLREEMST